jgi:enoyl-CoA hydratase/carnithine racemase
MNVDELQQITFDVQDKVAVVTLNRPDQMNTWTPIMSRDLSDAMYECDENDDIRAVVITGAGRAFCAGADLSGGEDGFTERTEIKRPPMWPYQVRKPVIAAINGAAVGVGITYSMLADIRLATPTAKIGFAMVRRGILPELASHVTVSQVAGFSRAADLLMTGRIFSGQDAADMGLISEVADNDRLLQRAMEIAQDIAINTAPVSVAMTKALMWQNLGANIPKLMETEGKLIDWLGQSIDVKVGVQAFLKKQTPQWEMSPTRDVPEHLADLIRRPAD